MILAGSVPPAETVTLTVDEQVAISAVVHQNYYMPDVFNTVARIIEKRTK